MDLDPTVQKRWAALLESCGETLDSADTLTTYRPWDSDAGGSGGSGRFVVPTRRFLPQGLLGRGGMGIVREARQASLGRLVAVKTLREDLVSGPKRRAQFLAEARIHGQLEHPNIVPVHDLDSTEDGAPLLAMKRVDGATWSAVLREGKRDLLFHLEVLLQVCNAVAYAHSHAIVHNDLKPSNVVLGPYGEVLVMDWGLAVSCADEPGGLRHRSALRGPCGTPGYVPPELAAGRGEDVSPRTDIYLLGGILYRLLAGRPPHGGSFLQALVASTRGNLPKFEESWPEGLRRISRRALAPDPAERYPDVASFQQELRAWLRHRESLQLSDGARSLLDACEERAGRADLDLEARTELYDDFAAAVAGFHEALRLWEENPDARAGERRARARYAETALAQGDLLLARSQAAKLGPEAPLLGKIARAVRRQSRDRWLRRGLAVGLALSLLVVFGGLSWALTVYDGLLAEISAKNAAIAAEKREAERQEAFARERGEIAARSFQLLTTEIKDKLLLQLGDARAYALAQEMLAAARAGWQQLLETELARDEVSRGSALALLALGDLERRMGEHQQAIEHFEEAGARFARLRSTPGADTLEMGVRWRETRTRLADVLIALERVGEAVPLLEEVLADTAGDIGPSARVQRAQVLLALASTHVLSGRLDAAERVCREGLALQRELVALEARGSTLLTLSVFERTLSGLLLRRGKTDEAKTHLARAEELQRGLLRSDSLSASLRSELAQTLGERAKLHNARREDAAAEEAAREAVAIRRPLVEANPLALQGLQRYLQNSLELAKTFIDRGDLGAARKLYDEVLAARTTLFERDPDDRSARRALADVHMHVAALYEREKDFPQSRFHLERQLALHAELLRSDTGNVQLQRRVISARLNLGRLLSRWGERDAAIVQLEQARAAARRLPDDPVTALENLPVRLGVALELSELHWLDGDLARADAVAGEAIARARASYGRHPELPRSWEDLALCLGQHLRILLDKGAFEDAEGCARELEALARRLYAEQPESVRSWSLLADALIGLAELARSQRDGARALEQAREAVEWAERLVGLDEADLLARRQLMLALNLLGDATWMAARLADAEAAFAEAQRHGEELLAASPGNPQLRRELAQVLSSRGELLRRLNDPAGGSCLQAAVALLEELCAAEPSRLRYREDLAQTRILWAEWLGASGAVAEAREAFATALATQRALFEAGAADAGNVAIAFDKAGDAALGWSAPDEAAEHFRVSLAIRERELAARPDSVQWGRWVAVSVQNLARAAAAAGDLLEARRRLDDAVARYAVLVRVAPQLEQELLMFEGQQDQLRYLCWQRGLFLESEEALLTGERPPETYAEGAMLGLFLLEQEHFGPAADAFRAAFRLGPPAGDDLVSAARAAALAAPEGEAGDALRREAAAWLADFFGSFERALAEAPPPERAALAADIESVRQTIAGDPSFASLRGLPELDALFE